MLGQILAGSPTRHSLGTKDRRSTHRRSLGIALRVGVIVAATGMIATNSHATSKFSAKRRAFLKHAGTLGLTVVGMSLNTSCSTESLTRPPDTLVKLPSVPSKNHHHEVLLPSNVPPGLEGVRTLSQAMHQFLISNTHARRATTGKGDGDFRLTSEFLTGTSGSGRIAWDSTEGHGGPVHGIQIVDRQIIQIATAIRDSGKALSAFGNIADHQAMRRRLFATADAVEHVDPTGQVRAGLVIATSAHEYARQLRENVQTLGVALAEKITQTSATTSSPELARLAQWATGICIAMDVVDLPKGVVLAENSYKYLAKQMWLQDRFENEAIRRHPRLFAPQSQDLFPVSIPGF